MSTLKNLSKCNVSCKIIKFGTKKIWVVLGWILKKILVIFDVSTLEFVKMKKKIM